MAPHEQLLIDETVELITSGNVTLNLASAAAAKGELAQCIHRLRQARELISKTLVGLDPSLGDTVQLTDAGIAATASDAEPTATVVDNPIPTLITGQVDRSELLALAEAAVSRTEYGPLEKCFVNVAEMWTAIFGQTITAERVALAMAAFKLARLIHDPSHVDSWTDLAGYAALGAELGTLPIDAGAT